jgi:hypothetical protein
MARGLQHVNVVVLSTHPRWITHFGTELEIIQRHLDDNDSVVHLRCDAVQAACDYNPEHSASKCRKCIGVCEEGLAHLSRQVPSLSLLDLTPADEEELARLPTSFATHADLRSFRIDNFDIGWAALSSVISSIRDPKPDLSRHADLIRRFINAALTVYRSVQHYLDRHEVDRMYVFNGRLASCRAVLRACQSRNVPCLVHERGCDLQHYELYRDAMPVDLAYVAAQIAAYWERASSAPKRDEVGSRFFTERARGHVQSWYSFVTSQREGLLPGHWDPEKTNLVIFNSSEDEFAAIGDEWRNPLYPTQRDGLLRMIESLSSWKENFHVYLRMHPNLRAVDNDDTRGVRQLSAPFLTVIPPDSPISTYALIGQADRVLSFGSTVGIEAVYWGTPSILAGPSLYRGLGGTYNPESHDELVALLKTELAPKDKTAALMYGYYYASFGIRYKYYRPTSVTKGVFRDQPLPRRSLLSELARRAKRIGRSSESARE